MSSLFKRIASLALAVMMLLTVTACSKKDTSSQTSDEVLGMEIIGGSSTDSTENTESNDDSAQSTGNSSSGDKVIDQSSKGAKVVNNCYVTGYPIAKQKITLKIMMPDDINGADPEKRALTKYLEQRLNVNLEFDMISNAQVSEKVTLAFASGKTPDLFWGMGLLGGNTALSKYVASGKLYSYDDYKEYAPNIYKMFNSHKDVQYLCTSENGKIYTAPLYREDTTLYTDYFYINKTWLKKLGLSMPKTLDDLTNILRKFRDNDPNGNGKKDEIPMMFVEEVPTSWYGFFGLSTYTSNTRTKDNKVKTTYLTEEYKKSLTALSEYYSERLLYNSEIRNITAAKAKSILDASLKTVGIIGGANSYSNVMSAETYINHYSLMPIIDATGKGEQVASYMDVEQCWPCWGFIPKTCKYPEIAVRLMDYFYTTEGSATAQYGPPSKSTYWNYNSAGKPMLNNNGTKASDMYLGHFVPRYMNESMLAENFFANDIKYKDETTAKAAKLDLVERANIYGNLKPRLTYNLPLTEAEVKKKNEGVSSNLTTVQKNYLYEFVYGTKNITSEWSTYINEVTRLGAKVSEEVTQAADTRMQNWLKKNK